MKTYIRALCLVLLFGGVMAGVGFFSTTGDLAFDQSRLARIDAHYQQAVDDEEVAGVRALIYQNDRMVYERNWGYRDIARKSPMSEDTIFHIYSMTKPITSVAVMMLFEEGKFLLHEPIAKYIPELANLRVYAPKKKSANKNRLPTRAAKRQPTIHDVLTHQAGFTYGIFDPTPLGALYRRQGLGLNIETDLKSFVTKLGKMPLKFDPGEHWHYSVSTDVLGRLVEVASGQKFSAFLQERIFGPLAMVDTSFRFDPAKANRQATLYSQKGVPAQFTRKGLRAQPTGPGLASAHKSILTSYFPEAEFDSGGAGLLSTTADYLRFARMLLNDGELDGQRLLAPNTVKMMRQDHLGSTQALARYTSTMPGDGIGFGLGFGMIKDQGLSSLPMPEESYFWGGAAGTLFWIDPKNEMIVLFMTQVLPHRTTLRQDMWPLTYQAIKDAELND